MCGRFALAMPRRQVAEALALAGLPEAPDRYNIAPGQLVEAVYADRHVTRRLAGLFRWGLVPSWAADTRIGGRLFNARAETVCDKPAFRAAIRYRRCLVPAQGFYEWRHDAPDGRKTPYFLTPTAGGLLVLAGLFEHWTGPDGAVLDSLALLTREATGTVRQLHDRMPVLLPAARHAAWLDPARVAPADIRPLCDTPPPELVATPVGTWVNSIRHEGPECSAPIGPPLVGDCS